MPRTRHELCEGWAGVDFASRPVLVIAASRMPDPKAVDYDLLLRCGGGPRGLRWQVQVLTATAGSLLALGRCSYIVKQLDPYVESDYVIVLLYSGMKYKLSWGWLRQAYNLLDRKCVAALLSCQLWRSHG